MAICLPAPCSALRAGTESQGEVWEFVHIEALAQELEEF